ncbi:ester cyclase [Rhodococcus rhodochrous]|uniref:Ester cyclase n=1 Tax=Rhodococcus rhodochrous TaxID=1829 RepID=A0AAW4XJU5_RHORH|nr:ester cyclase [Rhodococcus rhodochrous]MCD2113010.1 ester cyclase [Rhodococcus rhodochrous]QHG83533.1 hypothetical protein D1O33_17395 [Rhodococcus rhodochrous]QOH56789.1 hypothetical protein C6Y44_13085 [Rhodococcus rhodochrous]
MIGVGGFTRERKTAPPSARGTGPDAFYELALRLRAAFEDLRYEIHHAVTEWNLVTVNSTMHGHHTAPIAFYTEDGKIVERWANRDDLTLAKQLGWVPPTPAYLIRMARAERHAQRIRRRVAGESEMSRHTTDRAIPSMRFSHR